MGDVTQQKWEEIENEYLYQQLELNKRLQAAIEDGVDSLQEELKQIQNKDSWNNLSLFLRRYIHEKFKPSNKKGVYEIPYKDEKQRDKIYKLSGCNYDIVISEEEQKEYAELLFVIERENECFKHYADMLFRKKNEIKEGIPSRSYGPCITKDSFRKWMNPNRQNNLQRDTALKLSLALKFSVNDMYKLSNALGYSPIYNFRDVRESIIYYCHRIESANSIKIANEIYKEYLKNVNDKGAEYIDYELDTKTLRNELDQIIESIYSSEEEQRKVFIDYLISKCDFFTGFSKSARDLLILELFYPEEYQYEKKQLSQDLGFQLLATKIEKYKDIELSELSQSAYQQEQADIAKTVFQWIFEATDQYLLYIDEQNKLTRVNLAYIIGRSEEAQKNMVSVHDDLQFFENNNEIELNTRGKLIYQDFTGFEEGNEKIGDVKFDEKIRENIMSGARLRAFFYEENNEEKKHITKKDILTIRFYKLCKMIEYFSYDDILTEDEQIKIFKFFKKSTNRILEEAGLPAIYPANPFENLILIALCTNRPSEFIQKIFESAYEETL